MAYKKQTWTTDMLVATDKMNHIEQGIVDAEAQTERTTNRVTSVNAYSTDTQYPTAKAVYDLFNTINVTSKKY